MVYNIELKNVKIYESLSQETNCFTASLYINKKLVAYCQNHGEGGCTFINAKDKESDNLILTVDQWCKKNPIKRNGYQINSLEQRVDDIIDQKVEEKENKKIEKKCISNLCFTTSKDGELVLSYNQFGWKNVKNLSDMLNSTKGKEIIIKTIKTELSKGYRLINKNIPQELYK